MQFCFLNIKLLLMHHMYELHINHGNVTQLLVITFMADTYKEWLLAQARSVAEGILATVALMQDSRLPCFGRGAPVPNLRKRFHLDMTEAKAAAFMRSTILDAYDKVHSQCLQQLQNQLRSCYCPFTLT